MSGHRSVHWIDGAVWLVSEAADGRVMSGKLKQNPAESISADKNTSGESWGGKRAFRTVCAP